MRRLLAAVAALAVAAGMAVVAVGASPAAAQAASGLLFRFAAPDRVGTAIAVSQGAFPDGAERVYLARADAFPDALAGASLGGGPVLLVPSRGPVPGAILSEVARLRPELVVAFGGPGAIDDAVLAAAAGGRPTHRLGGATRFDTAVQISQFGFVGGATEVYLARADDFADALAAGSLHGGPILLVPRTGPVPGAVRGEIARLGPDRVLAVGGEQAVPEAILREAAGALPTGRLAGPDRYATAVAIARHGYGSLTGLIPTVVSGANFPDGLAAGGVDKGPVYLVPPCGALPAAVDTELQSRAPRSLAIIGGVAAICEDLALRVATAARVVPAHGAPLDDQAEPPADQIIAHTWVMPIRYAWGAGTEDLADWRAPIERAMASWEALGGIDFVPAAPGQVDVTIGFAQGCHEPTAWGHECFDGADVVLAHASIGDISPASAALHFDDAQVWVDSTTPGPFQFDLETVALHELGHVLGLGHLPQPEAVMHETYTGPRRVLTSADINAIRALYPAVP